MEPLPFINTILILGAAQGVFLALLILSKRTDQAANKVLAAAMLSFSVFIFSAVYFDQGWFYVYPRFIGLSQPIVFLFGPILYLYVRIVSACEVKFRREYWAHFIPFLFYIVYLIPVFLQDGQAKIELVEAVMRGEGPFDIRLFGLLKIVHGITYVVLTFRLIQLHGNRIKDQYSDIQRINLNWLRNLMIGIAAVWILAILETVLEWFGESTAVMVPLATSVFVYAMGYMGLRQSEIFGGIEACLTEAESRVPDPGVRIAGETKSVSDQQDSGEPDSVRYGRSGLTDENAETYLKALIGVMEDDRLFINGNLTLQDLTERLDISAHNLSEVINTRLGKNFYDFVNGYRIENVQEKLRDPKYDHLTILALATDAGFNSKSAFNTFFKKITGETPSEYRKRTRSET